jgi:hypothetical protein
MKITSRARRFNSFFHSSQLFLEGISLQNPDRRGGGVGGGVGGWVGWEGGGWEGCSFSLPEANRGHLGVFQTRRVRGRGEKDQES